MVRGSSTGAWKRNRSSLERFYETPGSEEFREHGPHGHGGIMGGRRDEHQNAVEKIIDSVVGNRPPGPAPFPYARGDATTRLRTNVRDTGAWVGIAGRAR